MTDERDAAAAADEGPDVLPEDLQPHLVDPEDYVFPNNNRRRVPGYLYLAVAVGLCLLVVFAVDSPFVNRGYLFAAAVLGAFGLYSVISGWNLDVDERDALVAAVAEVGFPVGHASAQMGWRGLLSRPTWRILLYSADEPPTKRGFVLVDGVDAAIVAAIVEDNPEDWSEMDEATPTATTTDADAATTDADGSSDAEAADEPTTEVAEPGEAGTSDPVT